jgi:hypothetical protein
MLVIPLAMKLFSLAEINLLKNAILCIHIYFALRLKRTVERANLFPIIIHFLIYFISILGTILNIIFIRMKILILIHLLRSIPMFPILLSFPPSITTLPTPEWLPWTPGSPSPPPDLI